MDLYMDSLYGSVFIIYGFISGDEHVCFPKDVSFLLEAKGGFLCSVFRIELLFSALQNDKYESIGWLGLVQRFEHYESGDRY